MANLWTIPVLCAKTEGCVAPLQQPLLYFCTPCDPSNDRLNFTHCNSVNHLLPSGYGINQSIRTEELQTNRLHHQTSTNTSSQMWAVNKIHSYVCSQRLWLSVIYFVVAVCYRSSWNYSNEWNPQQKTSDLKMSESYKIHLENWLYFTAKSREKHGHILLTGKCLFFILCRGSMQICCLILGWNQ